MPSRHSFSYLAPRSRWLRVASSDWAGGWSSSPSPPASPTTPWSVWLDDTGGFRPSTQRSPRGDGVSSRSFGSHRQCLQRQQLLLRADGHPVSSVLDYDVGVHPPRDVHLRLSRLRRGGDTGHNASNHDRVVGPGARVDRDGHGDDPSRRPGPAGTAAIARRESSALRTVSIPRQSRGL